MIFKFDLKRSLKTSVIFTAIMFIILVLGLIAYKCAFYKQDNFLSFINNLPSFVIKGLGIKTDGNYSFYDFYAILVNFILIIAALFASFIGFFCILKDKKDDADAFYFKKPINKVSIIKQKILACFVLLLASTLIYHIVAFIFIIIIKEKYISADRNILHLHHVAEHLDAMHLMCRHTQNGTEYPEKKL